MAFPTPVKDAAPAPWLGGAQHLLEGISVTALTAP